MNRGFISLLGILLLVPLPAMAEIFVNENFDDGAFGPPYQYLCDIPQPAGCPNTAEHTTAERVAGTHSLESVYNQYGAAGVKIYPSDYGHADFGKDTYFRIYVKYDANFVFHNRTKLIRWHGNEVYINTNATTANGARWKGWWDGEVGSGPYADIGIYMTGGPDWKYVSNEMHNRGEDGSSWVIHAGQGWWMIELRLNSNNGTFDLWVQRPSDGAPTKIFDQEPLPISATNGYVDVNWLNSADGGSGGKLWVDEIALADEPLYPVEGVSSSPPPPAPDTTPPSAPAQPQASSTP